MPPLKDIVSFAPFSASLISTGTFVNDLHKLRIPLDALNKKDATYKWTPQCQSSFDHIKATLTSDSLPTYLNPNLPIVVVADASNCGIGAVLSHQFSNGSEKAVHNAAPQLQLKRTTARQKRKRSHLSSPCRSSTDFPMGVTSR